MKMRPLRILNWRRSTAQGIPFVELADAGYNKRGLDLLILGAAHLLLAPFWLALWIAIPSAIWLADRGPLFYRQQQTGRGGVAFSVLNFRTMIADADRIGPAWTNADDPRVTMVGRVLRKTALDELPQLLAILKGDMSFVGPKPLAVAEHEALAVQIPGFNARLAVRPGLTGLAQVYNVEDDAEKKLRYDMAYIHSMSFMLDVKLILLSVRNTLMGKWDGRGAKPKA